MTPEASAHCPPRHTLALFTLVFLAAHRGPNVLAEFPTVSCEPRPRKTNDFPAACPVPQRGSDDKRCGFSETVHGECWAAMRRQVKSTCCPGAARGSAGAAAAVTAIRAAANHAPIYGYYHVGLPATPLSAVSARIYAQQMRLLRSCGLAAASERVLVGVSMGNRGANESATNQLLSSLKSWAPANAVFERVDGYVDPASRSYEAATLKVMYEDVQSGRVPRNAVVYYLHSKGGTGKTPSINVILWRRYMEYHVLEHPQWCLQMLSKASNVSAAGRPEEAARRFEGFEGRATCGVDWAGNHYSGNFWFATARHLAEREPPDLSGDANYVAAEIWVGKKKLGGRPSWHFSLCDSRFSLYKFPIWREFYEAV